ncbi:MAG: tubulin-like protein [Methanobrevibacter sp.]|nr:tubulin-like protein [Methanobrevibacter sp.]
MSKTEKVNDINEESIEDMEISEKRDSIENTIFMNFNGLNISLEVLEKQTYKNVQVVPIKTDAFAKKDFITLKKGIEMGLVSVRELDSEQVNTVVCKNDAVVPLLLIDGDEIVGAKQNRIMNETLLIPANSERKIPVSCTEHGRWRFDSDVKKEFGLSNYSLNFDTRRVKNRARRESRDYQSDVWNHISKLENRHAFKSRTSALNDNYQHSKITQDDYLKNLNIVDGQNGVICFINGEFKGIELFYNHIIYKEYHEKTLRSYIIEAIADGGEKAISDNEMFRVINGELNDISSSAFEEYHTVGLGENLKFGTKDASGSGLIFEDELIHMTYFKGHDDLII